MRARLAVGLLSAIPLTACMGHSRPAVVSGIAAPVSTMRRMQLAQIGSDDNVGAVVDEAGLGGAAEKTGPNHGSPQLLAACSAGSNRRPWDQSDVDLTITRIQIEGDQDREYVYMRVSGDCDVGEYLIADTTYAGGRVSNELRHVFWFPDKRVRAGDAVVLRTGRGTDNTSALRMGGTLHRFYWNLNVPVWNDRQDAAVLLKAESWTFRPTS